MRHALKWMVVAALLCPVAAHAEGPTDALAQKLVNLSVAPGIDGRFARMVGMALERQPAERRAQAKAEFDTAAAGVRADTLKIFTRYYATSFTPAELTDLVAFFESPLGKKLVAVEENKPAAVNAEIQQQIIRLVGALKLPADGGR